MALLNRQKDNLYLCISLLTQTLCPLPLKPCEQKKRLRPGGIMNEQESQPRRRGTTEEEEQQRWDKRRHFLNLLSASLRLTKGGTNSDVKCYKNKIKQRKKHFPLRVCVSVHVCSCHVFVFLHMSVRESSVHVCTCVCVFTVLPNMKEVP